MLRVYKHNIVLASKFVPRRFDGDLLLFVASHDATDCGSAFGRLTRDVTLDPMRLRVHIVIC